MITKPGKNKMLRHCFATLTLAVPAQYVMAQATGDATEKEKDPVVLDEVIVSGIRNSQRAAVEVKRNADNIVDAIVAEDIGKLPDVTIADSLQRVPGVQIDRTAGEGSSLNVRGMPQVLTTLNGEQFLSPWSITNVQANYSDIPAPMISGVDVNKSMPASMLAGGISGVIDLKTRRPLDLPTGWTGSAAFETSQGSITEDPNHDVNAYAAWHNERVGVALAAFTSETNSANYQAYGDSRFGFAREGFDPYDLNTNGNTADDRFLVQDGYGPRAYVMERDREGISGSFQVAFNDALTLTTEGFYTKMDQYDRGVEVKFSSDGTAQGWFGNAYNAFQPGSIFNEEATVPADGSTPSRTLYSTQLAVLVSPDFISTAASRQNHTDAINANVELAYNADGPFRGSIRFVYGTAKRGYEETRFQEGTPYWFQDWANWTGPGNPPFPDPYNVSIDMRGDIPSFAYTADLSTSDTLKKYQASAIAQNDEADLRAIRLDGSYDVEFAGFKSFDFGVRRGSRNVTTVKSDYMTPTARYHNWDGSTTNPDLYETPLPGNKVWQRYPDWADFSANQQLQDATIVYTDFGPFRGFESGVATVNTRQLDDGLAFMNRVYPGTQKLADPAKAYSVDEDATSGYVQGNFKSENDTLPFAGNFGLQVVRTDRTVVRNVVPSTPTPDNHLGGGWSDLEGWQYLFLTSGKQTIETSFTDVLPSLNINFYPRADLVGRISAAKTMSRNDLVNVGEGLTLWYQNYTVDGRQVPGAGGGNDQGNPYVKPWRANNYNASVEWYFGEGAILAGGLFYIDVKNATQTFQEQRQYPDADGVMRRGVNIWVTRDIGAAPLKGFEFAYRQPFTFLPGVLKNFGGELNYTYSDSDSGDRDLEGNSFPLQSNSEHQLNAVLWYQAQKFSGRIAYNWRSDIFAGRVGLNTNESPVNLGNWAEPSGYLDASLSYDAIDNVTLYLQGTNLTETNYKTYGQFESQFQSIYTQERRLAAGVRVRL